MYTQKNALHFVLVGLLFGLGITVAILGVMKAQASTVTVSAAPDPLDPSFGADGRVMIPITGSNQIARDVAIQPDGKLIIAGYTNWLPSSGGTNYDAVMARVNPDGSLDMSFGISGVVTTAFSSGNDTIYAIAFQPDGKIIAAGYISHSTNIAASVMRYNPDGSLDTSFGQNGTVSVLLSSPVPSWFLGVAVLDDGRILASGSAKTSPDTFLLARFQPNGTPDSMFGNNGVVTTTFPGGDANSWDLALQPDGKIILAGFFRPASGATDFALARYNADGTLDTGFGVSGRVVQSVGAGGDYAYGVNVQSSGKIIAGGISSDFGSTLLRYNADGSLDTSFGPNPALNYVTTTIPGYASTSFIETALQADDGIVAATRAGSGSPPIVAVTVFTPDGRPNEFYAPGGVLTATYETHALSSYALLVQPDDKVVLAGHVDVDDTSGYDYNLALWRFNLKGYVYLPLIARDAAP